MRVTRARRRPRSCRVAASTCRIDPIFKKKGDGPEALLRFDQFTPNTTASDQEQHRVIAGLAYWFPHPGGPRRR